MANRSLQLLCRLKESSILEHSKALISLQRRLTTNMKFLLDGVGITCVLFLGESMMTILHLPDALCNSWSGIAHTSIVAAVASSPLQEKKSAAANVPLVDISHIQSWRRQS